MGSVTGWRNYSIPAGDYHLSAALDDEIRAGCAGPQRRAGEAHPIFAFVVAIGGMGRPIGDVCRDLDLAFDSGAVLGRCRIDYDRPLDVDVDYRVDASIVNLERKKSRRFGAADHLTLRMTLSAGQDAHAHVELTTIMPGGQA